MEEVGESFITRHMCARAAAKPQVWMTRYMLYVVVQIPIKMVLNKGLGVLIIACEIGQLAEEKTDRPVVTELLSRGHQVVLKEIDR